MAERAEFDVTFQILTSLKAVCCTFWMPPKFDAYNGQIFGGSQRLIKFQILEWCIQQNLLGAKFGSIFQMFKIRKSHFRKLLPALPDSHEVRWLSVEMTQTHHKPEVQTE